MTYHPGSLEEMAANCAQVTASSARVHNDPSNPSSIHRLSGDTARRHDAPPIPPPDMEPDEKARFHSTLSRVLSGLGFYLLHWEINPRNQCTAGLFITVSPHPRGPMLAYEA